MTFVREMDRAFLSEKDKVLELARVKLGSVPIDFAEKMAFIKSTEGSREVHLAAGVLLLLHYRENASGGRGQDGGFYFQLIKRSSRVAQAGDLSCPGGMLHRHVDMILSPLITTGAVPILRGDARHYARKRGSRTFRTISLFLANAARESWEELGLNPFNILFLGPLPSYSLILFRRTIFPTVGFVKNEWRFRPNYEVDKVVEIPLEAFFEETSYARFSIEASPRVMENDEGPREFPCLIHRDGEGREEVLWGATFNIIMNFLNIVFDFTLPDFSSDRIVKRVLRPEYLTGSRK